MSDKLGHDALLKLWNDEGRKRFAARPAYEIVVPIMREPIWSFADYVRDHPLPNPFETSPNLDRVIFTIKREFNYQLRLQREAIYVGDDLIAVENERPM